MKQNCLFFGNCQMFVIKEILKTSEFNNYYNLFVFSSHLQQNEESLNKLYGELQHYSLIIIQPHYSNEEYTLNSIISKTNDKCKVIILPSSYFNGYYPNLTYALDEHRQIVRKPSDYHDKLIIDLYKEYKHGNITEKEIKEIFTKHFEDINYISKEKLEESIEEGIVELQKREDKYINEKYKMNRDYSFIRISTFIKNNYKKKLLFYSMNHPSIHLFTYICNEILSILDMDYCVNKFSKLDLLDNVRVPLYKCIKNVVNFDVDKHAFLINNKQNVNDLVKMYIEEYKNIKNIEYK